MDGSPLRGIEASIVREGLGPRRDALPSEGDLETPTRQTMASVPREDLKRGRELSPETAISHSLSVDNGRIRP